MAASTHRIPESKTTTSPSPFELIYEGAKEKNSHQIKSALLLANLNVQQEGCTPAGKLALEGNSEALDFLMSQFPAEQPNLLKYIAAGYAQGGFVNKVSFLLRMNSAERFALLTYITIGYARGGHVDEVYKIIRSTTNSQERTQLWICILAGFARSGNTIEAEKAFHTAVSENPAERMNLLMQLISNYARGGHIEKAENTVNSATHPTERVSLWKEMLLGYARGNYPDEVKKILDVILLNAEERFSLYEDLASAYAQSGLIAEANKILYLVIAEIPDYELYILRKMAYGYARGGHIAEANKLLLYCENVSARFRLLQEITAGNQDGEHVTKVASTQSPAELIYEGATERSISKIETALSSVSLHVQRSTQWTAATRLADEGNKEALAFLLARYPLETFTLKEDIVYGYARSGHKKDALELILLSFDNQIHTALLLLALRVGLAERGEDIEDIQKTIRSIVASSILTPEQTSSITDLTPYMATKIAYHYGRGGYVDKFDKLLSFVTEHKTSLDSSKTKKYSIQDLQRSAVEGCALMGHVEKVNQLFYSITTSSQRTILGLVIPTIPNQFQLSILMRIASGYARGHRAHEFYDLANKASELFGWNYHSLIKMALPYIMENYAQSGNTTELRKLSTEVSKLSLHSNLMLEYAAGGYVQESHRILNSMSDYFPSMKKLGSAFLETGHFTETIKTMQLIQIDNDIEKETKLKNDFLSPLQTCLSIHHEIHPEYKPATPLPEQKPIKSPFTLIYEGAKEKDLTKIHSALSSVSLLVKKGKKTVVSLLAFKGKKKAINFLFNNFPNERFSLLFEMISGYAKAGKTKEVNKLIRLATTPNEKCALLFSSINGYAEGGYTKKVEEILSDAHDNPLQKEALLTCGMVGYALGGYVEHAMRIYSLAIHEKSTDKQADLTRKLIAHFAQGGMKVETIVTLDIVKNMLKEPDHLLFILLLINYRISGYLEEAEKLIKLTEEKDSCFGTLPDDLKRIIIQMSHIYDYVFNDDIEKSYQVFLSVEDMFEDNQLEGKEKILLSAALAYANNGQTRGVNQLIQHAKTHFPDTTYPKLLQEIIKGYINGGHCTEVNRILNFSVVDSTQRFPLLESAITEYCLTRNMLEAKKILSLATLIEQAALIKIIAKTTVNQSKSIFLNRETTLFTVATFNIEHQKPLADAFTSEIKECKSLAEKKIVDVTALLPKAANLHKLISSQIPLTNQYEVQKNWPQIQEWLLMTGVSLVKKGKLYNHLFLKIANFIGALSYTEASSLQQCMKRQYHLRSSMWVNPPKTLTHIDTPSLPEEKKSEFKK